MKSSPFSSVRSAGIVLVVVLGSGCFTFSPLKPSAMPCIEALQPAPSGSSFAASGGSEPPEVLVQSGHGSGVASVELLPDGIHAIMAEYNPPRVKLWDLTKGREVRTFDFNEVSLAGVHVSADGRRLLLDSPARGIFVYDIQTGRALNTCLDEVGGTTFRSAIGKVSADGRFLASRDFSTVQQTGKARLEVWNVATRENFEVGMAFLWPRDEFSPQSDVLAVPTEANRVQLFDLKTRAAVRTFQVAGSLSALAFSADGATLYASNEAGKLWAFDRNTGQTVLDGVALVEGVIPTALAATRDGRHLVFGASQGEVGKVELANLRERQVFASAGRPAAAVSPDGSRLFVGTTGKFFLWRMADGRPEAVWEPEVRGRTDAARFTPDGKKVVLLRNVLGKQHVELIDLATKKSVWSSAPVVNSHQGLGADLSITPDGRFVLSGYHLLLPAQNRFRPTAQVIDVATGQVLREWALAPQTPAGWQSPAVGLSGGRVALAVRDGAEAAVLHVFDGETGAKLFEARTEVMVTNLDPSNDGRRLFLSGSQLSPQLRTGVWTFDVERRAVEFHAEAGKDQYVSRVLEGPSGRLVLGSYEVRSDPSSLGSKITQRIELRSSSGVPQQLAAQTLRWAGFSKDGTRILWVGDDGFVHVRKDGAGELLRVASFDDGEWVTMTPEGFFDASANGAQYISVRSGATIYAIDQFYERLYRPDVVLASFTEKQDAASAPAESLAAVLNQGPPPQVRIVSPAAGLQPQRDVELEVEVTDRGGGIGKIEWRINGAVVGVAGERGFVKARAAKLETHREKKLLTLSPGENTIEVLAYNAEGGTFSAPAQVVLGMKDEISEPPSLYILAIAINQYRDRSLKLSYAVPDARSLAGSFNERAEKVFAKVETTLLMDADATAEKIGATFGALSQKVKSNDVFVLFVAGHGITQDGRYHFLPVDFRYVNEDSIRKSAVNQDDLQKWMSAVAAKKSLVLLDTCNSGSFVQAQAVARGIQEKTAIDKLTRATGRATIAASTDTQVALEGHQGHGVFTFAVLDAFGKADRDFGNRDGVLTTTELAAFINEHVPGITYKRWGYEQVPQVNLHGREFPIAISAP